MKKSSLLLVIACFWLAGVFAQTGAIENLQVAQRTDGSGLVDIQFDLNGAGASYNLQFEVSFDDGANYAPLSEIFLTGELTNVLPGAGKHIIWAGKASHPETFSTQTRVRVIALEKTTFECGDPFVDQRDGKSYATVQIGEQCWMAENLAYLPNVSPSAEGSENSPFYYVFDYQGINVEEAKATDNFHNYGVLYNWPAAINACPSEWSLPSNNEWIVLTDYLGGYEVAGGKMKSTFTEPNPHPRWNLPNSGATNSSGFAGLPGGRRRISGIFNWVGLGGWWWASTETWQIDLYYASDDAVLSDGLKSVGYSVRCLKNVAIGVVTPTVTTSEITNITSTSATSGGNVTDDGGAPVTTRGLVWSTTPNPTMEENEGFTNDGEGLGEFTSEITGLQPETMYFVRAYAENSVGVGYGEELSFSTTEWQCGDILNDSRDGQEYSTVQIGDQCWMAENLKYLPSVSPSSQGSETDAYYYVYDYQGSSVITAKEMENFQNYGALYNWIAATNACPVGWYLPNDIEWFSLVYYVGTENDAGGKLKSIRTSPDAHPRWLAPNSGATDERNFSALPGGRATPTGFNELGYNGTWWALKENTVGNVWRFTMSNSTTNVYAYTTIKSMGFSVRCLKESTSQPNLPPSFPFNPSPETSSINQTITPTLTWSCSDPEGDPLTYDVYFGIDENPPMVVTGISTQTFTTETLQYSTTYHWKIVAQDDQWNSTEGEVWNFTTLPEPEWQCGDVLIDARDGQEYTTVQIGEQCWMAENLNIGTQINGSSVQLNNGTIEKYCYHNEETNCDLFGGLYQWNEVMDYSPIEGVQGICPDGWHLPTDDEWCVLEQEVDPTITCSSTWYRGVDGGGMLKDSGTTHWNSPNTGATNSSGFTALPGGNHYSNGLYGGLGDFGVWWSSSEYGSITAWARNLGNNSAQVLRSWSDKPSGLSIRCLKDDGATSNHPPSPPSNPSPETGSTNQPINLTLSWSCSDPESDPLTYDVYFGIDENPPLAISGISEQTYTPATLEYITSYNWKIVAHDDHGNSTEGEVWSFGTTNGDGQPCPGMPTVTDFDGNVYNTILIGEQCWMKENLKVTNYRNGTPIFYTGTNNSLWQNNTTGAYAFYVNDINWKVRYGVLYNWYAVNNINGLCPLGWHIPSDFEWSTLIDFIVAKGYPNELYDVNGAGNALKSCRKVNSPLSDSCNTSEHPRWSSNDTYHGFDVCGFSALPGGYRNSNGYYYSLGDIGDWWSSTEQSSTKAWGRGMYKIHGHIGRFNDNKSSGLSARCIKDQ